jgi:hypothetical protein
MKSVYACSKADGTLALAMDIVAIDDQKMIGALLKLAGESGLIVDRVDRAEVLFQDPILIRKAREERHEKAQLEINFSDGGKVGPSEMGEGFQCNFSGPCPHENKSCSNCEHAGTIFAKVTPEVAAVVAEPEIQPEGEPTLVDEINVSPMMNSWGKGDGPEGDEDEVDPVEETEAAIAGGILDENGEPVDEDGDEDEDDGEVGSLTRLASAAGYDDPDGDDWENAGESTPDEAGEAAELPF